MKIIKFGGKSLANGKGINTVLNIISEKSKRNDKIIIIVSARGNTTNQLEDLLELAKSKQDFRANFEVFKKEQLLPFYSTNFEDDFSKLYNLFRGVQYLGDYSSKIKDKILAYGELLSVKTITALLAKQGIEASAVDSRALIKTNSNFGNAITLDKETQLNIETFFKTSSKNNIHIVSGFIAANLEGETTTLGRNGSNYTASLFANYLNAHEVESYTHVDGIFTANPDLVADAKKIEQLSYGEANELANFGANILHAKTILPLIEKHIPLRILNTFNSTDKGTLISKHSTSKGIKSISVLDDVALLSFEGRGLLGKPGIDARIFNALGKNNISVSIISQGSSERGIGLVINAQKATEALIALEKEFETDLYKKDVNKITIIDEVAVLSIIGQELNEFHKPFNALIKNKITPLLFNNTVTGKNVSLVVKKEQLNKAILPFLGKAWLVVH